MSGQYDGIVRGRVKTFKEKLNFGFVEPESGGRDIFIHAGLFGRRGWPMPQEGDLVSGEVYEAEKGPAYNHIRSLEPAKKEKKKLAVSGTVIGRVKSFNIRKKFGFLEPNSGYEDVFIGLDPIKQAGIDPEDIVAGTLLKVSYFNAKKGPRAAGIELLSETEDE